MNTSKVPTTRATTAYGLLTAITKVIEAEPKRLRMGAWLTRLAVDNWDAQNDSVPACGTMGCICGWAIVLRGSRKQQRLAQESAGFSESAAFRIGQKLLGLTNGQAAALFSTDGFEEWQRGSPSYVLAALQRIRDFQHTHAKQLKATRV